MQSSARQRLGAQIGGQIGGRLDGRTTTVEYVNRLGERVSPTTGKPYDKANNSTNGLIEKKTRKRGRRRVSVKRAGSMFGNLEVIPTDVTRDPPPRACFNCWQQGHSRRECPRSSIARYCNNCGRRGEDLRSCPRCSRAHNEYLLRLQARERGEEVEPEEVLDESLLGGVGYENDDACDEVLRELIYQDDRARELRLANYSQEPYELASEYHERRQSEQSSYRDMEEGACTAREISNASSNYYGRRQDVEERDERSTSRQRDREYDEIYSYQSKERRSEHYDDREHGADSYYQGAERERDYEARASRSEARNNGLERRKETKPFENEDFDSDPVQEVLQLAKSIAHLTPETQDLIMRQVMAERKERVQMRAMKLQERRADDWH